MDYITVVLLLDNILLIYKSIDFFHLICTRVILILLINSLFRIKQKREEKKTLSLSKKACYIIKYKAFSIIIKKLTKLTTY